MGRERWFRGDHEGQERRFDWYALAREREIPMDQARVLYEEALRRAADSRGLHGRVETIYLDLLEEAQQATWRPAPGKVTRTMRMQAEAAGKRRGARSSSLMGTGTGRPLAPGKRTLSSYFDTPARDGRVQDREQERLEAIAGVFRTLGVDMPASRQESPAQPAPGPVLDATPGPAPGPAPDTTPGPAPGPADDRRYLASLDVLFGGDDEAEEAQALLDALDEEEAERRAAARPLPATLRARMEHAFGHDFADVMIHPDSPEATGATHALTRGRDIHVRADAYAPGTARGDWLIAHELAHVVQQTATQGPRQGRRALEAEADRAAHLALAGQRAAVSLGAPLGAAQAFSDAEEHEPVAAPAGSAADEWGGAQPTTAEASAAAPLVGAQANNTPAPARERAAQSDTAGPGKHAQEPTRGREGAAAAREGDPRAMDRPDNAQGGDAVAERGPGDRATAGSGDPGATSEGAAVVAHSPGAVLASLARARPSGAAAALAQARQASPAALQAQRDQAQASLPGRQTSAEPSRREAATPERDPAPGAAATAPEESLQPTPPAPEAGASKRPEHELVAEAPPVPTSATELAGREGGDDQESKESKAGNDPALARSAQGALAGVRMSGNAVQTVAADTPTVDVRGEADPGQLESALTVSSQQARAAGREAARAIHQDFGENDIVVEGTAGPDSVIGTLEASLPPGDVQAPELAESVTVDLPAEALASIDAEASPALQARIGAEQQRYGEGHARYHADSRAAHEQAHQEVAALEEDARGTQGDARASAQAEVTQARQDWQGEIDRVEADCQDSAAAARAAHRGKIQEEQQAGNRKAAEHIAEAERKAALEKRKAEVEAADKKRGAESESRGFWGWAKSAARKLVDGLKSAVNFIYDNLRKAVKGIFDAAKKLAQGAIELARKAIVGLISAYGALLKGFVGIALAAFPAVRDRMQRRIDQAVNTAVEIVNAAADALKQGIAAVMDFLAGTLDQLLGLVQDLYNGIFTVIGMLITGELQELMTRMGNLVAAASTAPGQFETAAYEELLGGDLDQPLSPAELAAAGRPAPAPTAPETLGAGTGTGTDAGADAGPAAHAETEAGQDDPLPGPPWTEDNVGVDAVASGESLSPELMDELLQRTGGRDGEVTFGESEDPSRSLESLLGLDGPAPAPAADQTGADLQANQDARVAYDDGLTPRERAAIKWEAMKKGLTDWVSQHWPAILAGGVLGVAGFIVANILTGGAILAALPVIMTAIGYLFTGVMVIQLAGHLRDFLQKGWNGDIRGGGKSLAKGLAAGAIELVSLLTAKVGSVAMKGARAAGRGAVQGAKAVARGTAAAGRGAMRIARRGAGYVLQGGKVLLRGVGEGIARGAKGLRDLGARLLSRTRFKGFRVRIEGRRFRIEGKINPWVKLVEGELVEVPEGTPGARRVEGELNSTPAPASTLSDISAQEANKLFAALGTWVVNTLAQPLRGNGLKELSRLDMFHFDPAKQSLLQAGQGAAVRDLPSLRGRPVTDIEADLSANQFTKAANDKGMAIWTHADGSVVRVKLAPPALKPPRPNPNIVKEISKKPGSWTQKDVFAKVSDAGTIIPQGTKFAEDQLTQWFQLKAGRDPSPDELDALMKVWGDSGHIGIIP